MIETRERFFNLYPKDELFYALGKLVIIKDFSPGKYSAYVETEEGTKEFVPIGLLRSIR